MSQFSKDFTKNPQNWQLGEFLTMELNAWRKDKVGQSATPAIIKVYLSLPECYLLAPGVIYISKNNISCQFLYGYKVKVILSHWALSHHITHELCLKCAVNVCASYWWQIYDTDQVVLRY